MLEENNYELVIAKIPNTNDSGRDVSNDDYGAGGKRDSEGKISALVYDIRPYEEKEAEESQLGEELACLGALAVVSLGSYLIGKHKEEIEVGFHKATRFVKSKIFKLEISEEKAILDEKILINKQIQKIKNADCKLFNGHNKNWKYHSRLIRTNLDKLSSLIDKYNSDNRCYSAMFLLNYLIPLREYMLHFEAISNLNNEEWNKVVSKLNLEIFLNEIRNLLKNENDNSEIIELFGNQTDDHVIETIRFLISDNGAA